MKHVKQLACLWLLAAAIMVSCQGESGAIGPQGPQGNEGPQGDQGPQGSPGLSALQKDGYIKGSVSGNRRDGTSFQENFENNYRSKAEGFYAEKGMHVLTISRTGEAATNNRIHMQLNVHNKGTGSQQIEMKDFNFEFLKVLPNQQAFVVEAEAKFENMQVVYPVSPTNTTYNFNFEFEYWGSLKYETWKDEGEGQYYIGFNLKEGSTAYFKNPAYDSDRQQYLGAFAFIKNTEGSVLPASDPLVQKYNALQLAQVSSWEFHVLDDKGTSLAETKELAADTYSITNYNHDAETGVVTFDYTVNVGTVGRYNTSQHPLSISGSVSSTVYNEIVYKANLSDEF